ncbi:kinase-like protein [Piromyces finnis]|uniref:Kinase-like protein n=1 Tax=Piromyces finnis TaxID=1754191 RepID=A0A1Y1V1F7_9FUNG|nr:kinase-like protein [Piromyces finnis]|eukprot:ORX44532.1 kinase-like protein [Piromyces finnis]
MSDVIKNTYNFELFNNEQYVIGEKIGEGSYGYVYKVIDLNSTSKELYALKILKPSYSKRFIENLIKYSTNNPENVDDLYRSYRGRRSILHKYKMIYLDNIFLPEGEIITGYATLSELASYGNLDNYLKEHKNLNYSDRLEIVNTILNGIQNLHCKTICHSALKAENILVFKKSEQEQNARSSRSSRNKSNNLDIELSLSDFSVIPSFSERSIISPNEFYASYTSPDCIKYPNNGYSFEDDIYSFGLLLWQIAYNETPFLKEFKEINNIKLNNVILNNNSHAKNGYGEDSELSPILPIQNDNTKEMPYEFKKKIEERNKEIELLESYNKIQQSTHYINDNYKLNLNRPGRVERHSQNNELLKLYNLIVENQLRPEVGNTIPSRYHDLILNCWNNQSKKRPDLVKIEEEVTKLMNSSYKNKMISLDYKLSDRQSKSLSKCLNDSNATTYIHTNATKKEKTKSVWNKFNPRNSIMKIINKTKTGYNHSRSDLRKTVFLNDDVDSPINDPSSSKNPLLYQNEIEMENIQLPEQIGYNNIPIGHCENDYTTINIDSGTDTVIIDTNPPLTPETHTYDTSYSSYNDVQKNYDANTSYLTDTTHANNVSYISSGINDSIMENSTSVTNDTYYDNYYSSDEHENTLIYPDLDLTDIEQDNDVDSIILQELNLRKKSIDDDINDPLNSKQVNNEFNTLQKEKDISGHFSNATSFTYSDKDENEDSNISNYSVAKNYINYTTNKRNTLFAFLESKTSANTNDDLELSSSEENINFYDEEDIKQLTEKTASTNSIKDDLKNAEKAKGDLNAVKNDYITKNEYISSPIANNNDGSELEREMYRFTH